MTEPHFHVCPACKEIWSHHRDDVTPATREKMHTCPKCGHLGEHSFWAYETRRDAQQVVRMGHEAAEGTIAP